MTKLSSNSNQAFNKERADKYGEVYTPENVVKDMLNNIGEPVENLTQTILEPSCGNGNFLVEIAKRKVYAAYKQSLNSKTSFDYLVVKGISTIYGVDIIPENIAESRSRMLRVIREEYDKLLGIPNSFCGDLEKAIQFILSTNIILGDTLKGTKLRESRTRVNKETLNSNYTSQAIPDGDLIITEWNFNDIDETVYKTLYSFNNIDIEISSSNPVYYLDLAKEAGEQAEKPARRTRRQVHAQESDYDCDFI